MADIDTIPLVNMDFNAMKWYTNHVPRDTMPELHGEWLVELQAIGHPEVSVVEIVRASSDLRALRLAFEMRNVPWNWRAVAIERA